MSQKPKVVRPLGPSRFVQLLVAEQVTGYSVQAIQTKISRGVWVEGRQWVRAPDGHILIDLQGYEEWAASHYTPASRFDQAA